ncbi:MAG: NAD-dependent epimerase/dehydratase family protein, partial [Methylocystaceae bacterium]|nr:NAD-dependent epimerase/dehydratase family protein [Methylocystaceae bacterium]
MTLLITGGAGYIGSHMAWLCHDQNISCVVLDDLSTGFSDKLPQDTPLVVGDVADETLLEELKHVEEAGLLFVKGYNYSEISTL